MTWGPISFIDIAMVAICAGVFYKVAEIEKMSVIFWPGASICVFLLNNIWLGWGLPGILIQQIILFGGMSLRLYIGSRKI